MGVTQTPVRTHRYSVAGSDLEEFVARRAAMIDALRAAHPGLIETRLTRLDDGSYTDSWRWESAETMIAAAQDLASFPQAPAAMSLTTDHTVTDGVVIDER